RGLTVRSQLELLGDYVARPGWAAGRELTERERADVDYGLEIASLLAERVDAGQTVVVKEGVVLALEAAEGTDETIRRGGRLGGRGRAGRGGGRGAVGRPGGHGGAGAGAGHGLHRRGKKRERMTRLLFSAGEASGDMHAADLIAALKARVGELEMYGMGGPL